MRVRKEFGYLLLIGIGVISIVGLLGATWLYANFSSLMGDKEVQAELVRLNTASQIYRQKLGSYQGVCNDIGVRPGYLCNETKDSFAISVEKSDSLFYCIDSEGRFGEQILPIRNKTVCSQ